MRPAAVIKSWLSVEKMFGWLQDAPDEASYKMRMAIWLTYTGKLHAHKIAEILGVSTQAVWLWIRQYNAVGSAGLDREGRGGRRWGFLTAQEEAGLLKPFLRKARTGYRAKPAIIKNVIEQKLGKKVSMAYIYRLLSRHGLGEIVARSKRYTDLKASQDSFQKLSHPWGRDI